MPPIVTPSRPQPLDASRRLAQQAIDLLSGHGTAPTPISYTVAYEYYNGGNEGLCAAIDALLEADKRLDEFFLRDLYERHIASDQFRQLAGMGGNLQELLQTLMKNIADAGKGASTFNHTLEKNIGSLSSELNPENLQAIALDMLAASQSAQMRNRQLQQRLESTLQETENLRQELEVYRREALIDPLTGLFNRRALDHQIQELLAADSEHTLSVVMVDIDHFKRINDTYGHALGDVVIRNVAESIRNCVRGDDFAVRYGGEEFMVLLPHTPLEGAVRVAETIRARIESLRLVRKSDNFTLSSFTVSLGVATRRPGDTQDMLFQRADQALYQSKDGGRNRVTIASELH